MRNFKVGDWVTADLSGAMYGILTGIVTEGKDYKVLNTGIIYPDTQVVEVKDDNGYVCRLSSHWFDDPEEVYNSAPTPCDEVGCDSFDDLVYVEPSDNEDGCYVIDIKKLTIEQKDFLKQKLHFRLGLNLEDPEYFWYDADVFEWATCKESHLCEGDEVITFNDIFIHKSQL